MEITQKQFGARSITIYKEEGAGLPTVFLNMYVPDGTEILNACRKAGGRPFHLITFSGLNWDQDLSPWPHAPVVDPDDDFTGGAPAYLKWIVDEVLPYVDRRIPDLSGRILAGYSMGGLFALYALSETAAFDKACCVSGSVWFPDFVQFFQTHPFAGKPEAIYLSLGNQESKVRNPWLQKTRQAMEAICACCKERGVDTVFELVPGNHFQNPVGRTANGIVWTLCHGKEQA